VGDVARTRLKGVRLNGCTAAGRPGRGALLGWQHLSPHDPELGRGGGFAERETAPAISVSTLALSHWVRLLSIRTCRSSASSLLAGAVWSRKDSYSFILMEETVSFRSWLAVREMSVLRDDGRSCLHRLS